jgi:hypothetical protein
MSKQPPLDAKDYREMAEEIRTFADNMKNKPQADVMHGLAADYDRMSRTAELIEEVRRVLDEAEAD